MRLLKLLTLVLGLSFAAAGALPAAEIPAPSGPVVLRVSGLIAHANDASGALFDMAALEALPATELVTATAWTEGETVFEGVLLRDLLAAVGAEGRTLHAIALNDYAVDLPASDAALGVLVAYRMAGEAMPVRDKGPLWIVYPVSQHPDLVGPETEGKMIWQLRDIVVQ